MKERSFTKQFRGDRAEKRYQNELDAHLLFPDLIPAVLSTDEELLEITFEHISGDSNECSNEFLSAVGTALANIHKSHQSFSEWKNSNLIERYKSFSDKYLVELVDHLLDDVPKPLYGFTHGDYRRRNILSLPDTIKVVDWEFFGINFVYWDLAIFVGDYVHQKFHNLQTNSLKPFWEGYLAGNELTKEELGLCKTLGGLDIIADHILLQPGEKPPEPKELFLDFNETEKQYLLDHENYM